MAYVDKDKLYEAITDLPYSEGCAVYDSDDVENTIRNFPEADVQEVKHGKWIENKKVCASPYCSVCGARGGGSYCHHCGAKMDLEEN